MDAGFTCDPMCSLDKKTRASKMTDLIVNRKLINSSFDGYKLGQSPLDIRQVSLISKVNKVTRDVNRFTYNYVHFLEMQNHLYKDPWSGKVYYFCEEYSIVVINQLDGEFMLENVFQFKDEIKEQVYNGILSFPSEEICLVTRGSNKLYVLNTQHRKTGRNEANWTIVYTHTFKTPVSVLSSHVDSRYNNLHILLLLLIDSTEYNSPSSCIIHWLQVKMPQEDIGYNVKGMKSFKGHNIPKTFWFDDKYVRFFVCSEKPYCLVDSFTFEKIEPKEGPERNGDTSKYSWSQSNEMLTVTFDLHITENELECCNISFNSICVKLSSGEILLEGNLEKDVITDASKWYIRENRLEVVLVKKESGLFWSSVVPNEEHGRHVIGGEEQQRIDQVHEQLKHLTSDGTTKEMERKSEFNLQQLEDCDENVDEDVKVFSVDVFTGEVDIVRSLAGYQWIFSYHQPSEAPSICIRYDVDGTVWVPRRNSNVWEHVTTFDALGYIYVSKQERKFVTCPPSYKYVVITDCQSHVYIYDSKSDDRKVTSRNQYIATFRDCSQILGCQATDDHLYILTDRQLNVVTLPAC